MVISADPSGFQRAIGNLVSNAARFAKSHVTISAEVDSDDNIRLDIDDDGCGIPVAERSRVLEPFVRLEHSDSSNGRGVGLGLALVDRIVSQHGGQLLVLETPSGGCRIRTTWPTDPDVAGEIPHSTELATASC